MHIIVVSCLGKNQRKFYTSLLLMNRLVAPMKAFFWRLRHSIEKGLPPRFFFQKTPNMLSVTKRRVPKFIFGICLGCVESLAPFIGFPTFMPFGTKFGFYLFIS